MQKPFWVLPSAKDAFMPDGPAELLAHVAVLGGLGGPLKADWPMKWHGPIIGPQFFNCPARALVEMEQLPALC